MQGQCSRANCKFNHPDDCKFFQSGHCSKGDKCKFRHLNTGSGAASKGQGQTSQLNAAPDGKPKNMATRPTSSSGDDGEAGGKKQKGKVLVLLICLFVLVSLLLRQLPALFAQLVSHLVVPISKIIFKRIYLLVLSQKKISQTLASSLVFLIDVGFAPAILLVFLFIPILFMTMNLTSVSLVQSSKNRCKIIRSMLVSLLILLCLRPFDQRRICFIQYILAQNLFWYTDEPHWMKQSPR